MSVSLVRQKSANLRHYSLCDVLEVVRSSLVSSEPSCEGDEQLGQRRVDVHEERSTDVLRDKIGIASVEMNGIYDDMITDL